MGEITLSRVGGHPTFSFQFGADLLESKIFSDVTISFGERGPAIKAHRAILAAHSSFLRDVFFNHPEVDALIFPEISFETVGRALEILYQGCSSRMSHELMKQVQMLLKSLGYSDLFTKLVISDKIEREPFNPVRDFEDVIVGDTVNYESGTMPHILEASDSDATNYESRSSNNHHSLEWECSCGIQDLGRSAYEYREHFAHKHYSANLLAKYNIASTRSKEAACPICDSIPTHLIKHLGARHKAVDEFLTQAEKDLIKRRSIFYNKSSKRRVKKYKPIIRDDRKDEKSNKKVMKNCPSCGIVGQFITQFEFRVHLSIGHYRERIEEDFNLGGREFNDCLICHEVGLSMLQLTAHIGAQHGQVDQFAASDEIDALSLLKEVPSMPAKSIICPQCGIISDNHSFFKGHLISHYKEAIFQAYNIQKGDLVCLKCGKELASMLSLARHIVIQHDTIDQFISEEEKEILKKKASSVDSTVKAIEPNFCLPQVEEKIAGQDEEAKEIMLERSACDVSDFNTSHRDRNEELLEDPLFVKSEFTVMNDNYEGTNGEEIIDATKFKVINKNGKEILEKSAVRNLQNDKEATMEDNDDMSEFSGGILVGDTSKEFNESETTQNQQTDQNNSKSIKNSCLVNLDHDPDCTHEEHAAELVPNADSNSQPLSSSGPSGNSSHSLEAINSNNPYLKWECSCGTKDLGRNSYEYRKHLAWNHYRGNLMAKYELADSKNKACPICGRMPTNIIKHLGAKHKAVDKFLTQVERDLVNQHFLVFRKHKSKIRANSKDGESTDQILKNCPSCGLLGQFNTKFEFRVHLSISHYRERIEEDFNLGGREVNDCQICHESGLSMLQLTAHIGAQHGKVDQFAARDEIDALSSLSEALSMPTKNIICPQCGIISENLSTFKGHLFTHYKEAIFQAFNIQKGDLVCLKCGKELASTLSLARHVATTHNMIDQFLSKEEKEVCKEKELSSIDKAIEEKLLSLKKFVCETTGKIAGQDHEVREEMLDESACHVNTPLRDRNAEQFEDPPLHDESEFKVTNDNYEDTNKNGREILEKSATKSFQNDKKLTIKDNNDRTEFSGEISVGDTSKDLTEAKITQNQQTNQNNSKSIKNSHLVNLEEQRVDEVMPGTDANSRSLRSSCPSCDIPVQFKSKHEFRAHLSMNHYREKIRELMKVQKEATACPICEAVSLSSLLLAAHVGAKHKKVDIFITEDESNKLSSLRDVPGVDLRHRKSLIPVTKSSPPANNQLSKISKPKIKRIGQASSSDTGRRRKDNDKKFKRKCPSCSSNSVFRRPSYFRQHLAKLHYKDAMCRDLDIGEKTEKCPICQIYVNSLSELLHHMASAHKSVDKYLNEEELDILNFPEIDPEVLTTQPTSTEEDERTIRDENLCINEYQSGKTCPSCNNFLHDDKPYSFRKHLSLIHYKDQLMKDYIDSSDKNCPVCMMPPERGLLEHLGAIHEIVDAYLNTKESRFLFELILNQREMPLGKSESAKDSTSTQSWDLKRKAESITPHQLARKKPHRILYCLSCGNESQFMDSYTLKVHLVLHHYEDALLGEYNLKHNEKKCPICSEEVMVLAVHLAIEHKKLDQHLSGEDKANLCFSMG